MQGGSKKSHAYGFAKVAQSRHNFVTSIPEGVTWRTRGPYDFPFATKIDGCLFHVHINNYMDLSVPINKYGGYMALRYYMAKASRAGELLMPHSSKEERGPSLDRLQNTGICKLVK